MKPHMCAYCGSLEWDKVPLIVSQDNRTVIQTSDGQTIAGFMPIHMRFFALVANNFPRAVSREAVMEGLYFDDPTSDVRRFGT